MTWASAAEQFTKALATAEPTPGGGAAAAVTGAMGCALALMAIGTTLKRKSTPVDFMDVLEKSKNQLEELQATLQKLARQDADAYATYMAACKLPQENSNRLQAIQDALWLAAAIPANTAAACKQAFQAVCYVEGKIAPVIVSDVLCSKHLLQGALSCCIENIRANLAYITEPERIKKLTQLLENYESNRK